MMRTRIAALLVVAAWAVLIARNLELAYVLGILTVLIAIVAAQDVLGRSKYHRTWHKYAFVILDAILLTFASVVPNIFTHQPSTPLQLRGQGSFFYYLFLVSTVLSLSPWYVLWTSIILGAGWSAGVLWVIAQTQPETNFDIAAFRALPLADRITLYLDPNFVDVIGWCRELLLFMIMGSILAIGVKRARRLVRHQAAAERERGNLARYFSPNMVDALATQENPLGRGRRQDVAVLFADIVGFSAYAEHAPPEQVIAMLRAHFDRLCNIVFAHDGTLDKYIGDALMATFGTPDPGRDDATRALRCARAMLASLAEWNRERAAHGEEPVRIGIGVHYGPVVLGNVGGERRLEFTVIGDTVNIAARLEALTRIQDVALIISAPFVEAVQRETGDADLAGLVEGEKMPLRGR